jgi:hypothetical protein
MKETAKDILKRMPKEGFIKLTSEANRSLSGEQRTALIRKGNALFNQGKIDLAKRIFLTAGYTDGLIRLGDYYYKRRQPLEAFRMYRLAPYKSSSEKMLEKMAMILRSWLKEKNKG